MLLLADIKDYLKTLGLAEYYYTGKLDNKKEKSIGVYQRNQNNYQMAIGGLKNKKYDVKSVSILLHWTKNARETEEQALLLFEKLADLKQITMNGTKVYYVIPRTSESVDVGTDHTGVYERIVWLDFYYER